MKPPETATSPFAIIPLDEEARRLFEKIKAYAQESAMRTVQVLANKGTEDIRELERSTERNEETEINEILRDYSLLLTTINNLPDPENTMKGYTRMTIASGIGFMHQLMKGFEARLTREANTFVSPGPQKTVERLSAIAIRYQKTSEVTTPELHTLELRLEYAEVARLLDFDETTIRRNGLMEEIKLEEAMEILRKLINHDPLSKS